MDEKDNKDCQGRREVNNQIVDVCECVVSFIGTVLLLSELTVFVDDEVLPTESLNFFDGAKHLQIIIHSFIECLQL